MRNREDRRSGRLVDLNFKVDPEFRRIFKMQAVTMGVSGVDLFQLMFFHYKPEGLAVGRPTTGWKDTLMRAFRRNR
jgi:hypothetical protein